MSAQRIRVIDSHTGGEPTRVVVAGGPDLGGGSMFDKRRRFRAQFDDFRSAVVNEPRGSDALVGALLCAPAQPRCAAGVIFFNNVGYLGMCGHGTIGVAVTLAHLGRISAGSHRLDTPAGVVEVRLHEDQRVTIRNVPCYRLAAHVPLDVPGHGRIHGDVAWGGNWFFLVHDHGQALTFKRLDELTAFAARVRQSLGAAGITGADGAEIDHIELLGPPKARGADSKNFVLCPGLAYDRSPCGTGTSAHLACLYADGKLKPGQLWRQESIVGSIFEGSVSVSRGNVYPEITGSAYISAEAELILDERDPFRYGIFTARRISSSADNPG